MTALLLLYASGLSACERGTPDDPDAEGAPDMPNPARVAVDGGCAEPVAHGSYDDLQDSWTFTDNVCVEEVSGVVGEPSPRISLADLRPARPVDAIALRYCSRKGCLDGFVSGDPCGTASDPTRCREQWMRTARGGWSDRPEGPFPMLDSGLPMCFPGQESKRGLAWGFRHLLVYSRGDEVGFLHDAAELKQFLGPIDTPREAALLVTYGPGHWIDDPWRVACEAEDNVRSTKGGFELLVSRMAFEGCVRLIRDSVVSVSADGAIREIAYHERRL